MFRLYGSDDIRHLIIVPVTLLLALLFALALAACSNADSVDRSVAASDSDQKLRTEAAVAGAGETTVGVAAAAGETGDPSGVPFRTRPEASGDSSYEADAVLAVRHGAHEGYKRVVLDLGTGERPSEPVPE